MKKAIKHAELKDITNSWDIGDITYSKMVELINSKADDFAIGFAEWMHDNCYYNNSMLYKMYGKGESQFDLKELLEIYKKEQEL